MRRVGTAPELEGSRSRGMGGGEEKGEGEGVGGGRPRIGIGWRVTGSLRGEGYRGETRCRDGVWGGWVVGDWRLGASGADWVGKLGLRVLWFSLWAGLLMLVRLMFS